jgi:AcrR family transcriptional regulator
MAGDSAQTKKRLLDAAADEFSEHGVAGARVDRIAQLAGCNKALIYSYFGNKEQLFEAVFEALVGSFVESTPIDAEDLPEYVGRLFDRYEADPRVLRLAAWYQLERAGSSGMPAAALRANQRKHRAISAAQKTGALSKRFKADELLTIIFGLSSMWGLVKLGAPPVSNSEEVSARRKVVTEAMRLMLRE